jgi:hypothetical protein
MLQVPYNDLLVEITHKYEDTITFKSGVKLFIDPSFNPNFHATSEGIVHSVPKLLRDHNAGEKMDIRPGDTVIFSYKTVGDITFQDNTHLFRMTSVGEGYATEWMNQERETLRLVAGYEKGKPWVCMWLDKHLNLLQGFKGTHGQCENWMATNFKFAEGEGFKYDNRLYYEDKELWRVDFQFVFGYKRDGHLTMLSDYLLCEPILEDLPIMMSSMIERPEAHRLCLREQKGWLRAGERGGLRNGDVLYFDPNMKEKYNFENKPMIIVRRRFVLGKESALEFGQPMGIN